MFTTSLNLYPKQATKLVGFGKKQKKNQPKKSA
jgi:hypothetical protein